MRSKVPADQEHIKKSLYRAVCDLIIIQELITGDFMAIFVESALRKARKYMQAGQSEKAASIYVEILSKFPNNRKASTAYKKLNLGVSVTLSLDTEQVKDLVTLFNQGKFEEVLAKAYNLKNIFPKSALIFNILGAANERLKRYDEAIKNYKIALRFQPNYADAYYNLGNVQRDMGFPEEAIDNYKKVIQINAGYAGAYLNMGGVWKKKGELNLAIDSYNKAIESKPDFAEAYLNLGTIFDERGDLDAAISSYKKALEINPHYAIAYNNMGVAFNKKADLKMAIESHKKALIIEPNNAEAYWNLYGTSSDITIAKEWLTKCLNSDAHNTIAKLTLAALNFYEHNEGNIKSSIDESLWDHPYTRSFSWCFSLPKLPKLYFTRWNFFDAVSKKAVPNRPFYEYGVWRGASFEYLIKIFKKGYGFDTFEGLPEDWHYEKAGTYSSEGIVPKIDEGEFISGKFKDTLPEFFSVSRPMASLINFDADLFSSTLCALNYSKSIIDNHTILIFDEFLINELWECDEHKALEDFCKKNDFSYEVIAVSFFTKQVAVKLLRNASSSELKADRRCDKKMVH